MLRRSKRSTPATAPISDTVNAEAFSNENASQLHEEAFDLVRRIWAAERDVRRKAAEIAFQDPRVMGLAGRQQDLRASTTLESLSQMSAEQRAVYRERGRMLREETGEVLTEVLAPLTEAVLAGFRTGDIPRAASRLSLMSGPANLEVFDDPSAVRIEYNTNLLDIGEPKEELGINYVIVGGVPSHKVSITKDRAQLDAAILQEQIVELKSAFLPVV